MKDLRADSAVQAWIDRLGPSGEDQYRTVERFLTEGLKNTEFEGSGLSDLVRFQETAVGRDRYRIGNLARNYFNRLQLSRKSKNTYLSRILSAFLHNHVMLPPTTITSTSYMASIWMMLSINCGTTRHHHGPRQKP